MFSHTDKSKNCTKKYIYQIRQPKESTLALKRLLRLSNTPDLTKRIQFLLMRYSKMMPSVTGKFLFHMNMPFPLKMPQKVAPFQASYPLPCPLNKESQMRPCREVYFRKLHRLVRTKKSGCGLDLVTRNLYTIYTKLKYYQLNQL